MPSNNGNYKSAIASFEPQFGPEVAQELVDEFFDALNSMMEDMRQALSDREPKTMRVITHRLIGLCPIYQAGAIATLSQKIEDELARDNWAAIDKFCEELFEEYGLYSDGRQVAVGEVLR